MPRKAAEDPAEARRVVAAFGRRNPQSRSTKHRRAVIRVAVVHRRVARQRFTTRTRSRTLLSVARTRSPTNA